MKVIVFDNEIDSEKELELIDDSEFGLDILIKFKTGQISIRRNCTEFHHLFNIDDTLDSKRSAFESDIHGTGSCLIVDKIDLIVVSKSTKHYDEHFEESTPSIFKEIIEKVNKTNPKTNLEHYMTFMKMATGSYHED